MALDLAIAWECRTTGNNANSGGFKTGASGTDRTLQDAAHATLTTASVVHSTTTQINVSAGDYTVSATDVGNTFRLAGGSATAGVYEITTADVGNNRWTLDRAVGTAGQTCPGLMGGAVIDIHTVANASNWVAGNTIWVKAGTYTRTATTTITGGRHYDTSARGNRVIGYNTTRGDTPTGTNRPLIQLSTNSGLAGIIMSAANGCIENIRVDCANLTSSTGFQIGAECQISNCHASNFKDYGIRLTGGGCLAIDCIAEDGTSGTTACFVGTQECHFIRCWARDTVGPGFVSGVGSTHIRCLATNCTGASSDGFFSDYYALYQHCVSHGNGRDGIRYNTLYNIARAVHNCILTSNSGYGIGSSSAHMSPPWPYQTNNAFRANGTAQTNGLADTGGSHASGTAFANSNVTLSADPYTNAAGNDFTLNNTAGGGAACRNVADIQYLDIGAYQHDPLDDAPPSTGLNRSILPSGLSALG